MGCCGGMLYGFAQKTSVSATEYYSLSDFRFTKSKKDMARQLYINGSYGALPITSEYSFNAVPVKGEDR